MNEKPPPKSHPPRSPFLRKGEEERMLRGAITPSAERGKKSERFTCDYPFRRKGSPRVPLGTCGGGCAVGRKAIPGKAIPLVALRARSLSLRPSCGRGKKSETLRARSLRSALPAEGGRRANASLRPSCGKGKKTNAAWPRRYIRATGAPTRCHNHLPRRPLKGPGQSPGAQGDP